MAFPSPTKTYHNAAYAAIDPTLPALSSKGKNIVISGGGSGMGVEMAKAFAKSGAATIALLGRTEKSLLETKQQIEAEHTTTQVSTYVADIVSAPDLERALAAHSKAHGKLHVLVANAGYMSEARSIGETDADDWWKGFEINVKGTFNLVRAFLPHATSDAAVLATNSSAAHMPAFPGVSGYAASKLAAAKVFEYLHQEYPELFVLSIQPGVIRTAMSAKAADAGIELPFDDGKFVEYPGLPSENCCADFAACSQPPSFVHGLGRKQ